jgi:predicted small lipoprotein YifL
MRARLATISCATVTLGLLALAGCGRIDPLERPYMWHATDVNKQNIAAMAVNPHDLVRGRESRTRLVKDHSDAIDRIWSSKLTPLISSGSPGSSGGSTGSGGGVSGGGGTGGS